MIEQLDEAARPQGEVRVMRLPGGISGPSLQAALRSMSAETISPARGSANVAKPANSLQP
jgi:hypothetical protein